MLGVKNESQVSGSDICMYGSVHFPRWRIQKEEHVLLLFILLALSQNLFSYHFETIFDIVDNSCFCFIIPME